MSAAPTTVAQPLSAERNGPLKGRVRPPGDKSISHRAFIFGLLSRGETQIEGLLEGDDVLRTGDGLPRARRDDRADRRRALGASTASASARFSRRASRSTSATPAPARD